MPPENTLVDPNNMTDMLEGDEHVLVIVRKHWIGAIGIYILAAASTLALIVLAFIIIPDLKLSPSSKALATLVASGVLAIFTLMTLLFARIYHQSKLTLTDKSLVQRLQRSLFNCKISRLSMSNVEDVNVDQRGIAATVFNFGTLTVQTAGEQDNFVFTLCPTPNVYAEKVLEARQAYARHHPVE
ncbi:MAG: hypothetical protein JWO96_206 [Candidatus Saccharibacteria bacterium]|nr:hypothetical protein [Candidatus Saccharibacteria bacterium]